MSKKFGGCFRFLYLCGCGGYGIEMKSQLHSSVKGKSYRCALYIIRCKVWIFDSWFLAWKALVQNGSLLASNNLNKQPMS